jgi:hypothetical protein
MIQMIQMIQMNSGDSVVGSKPGVSGGRSTETHGIEGI